MATAEPQYGYIARMVDLFMTSVKDFTVDEPATDDRLGRGSFVFTDAYSIFDWGKMPDTLPDKGASLCTMGAYNFERLEAAGIPTHYRGVVREQTTTTLDEASSPPTEMAIELTQVPSLPHTGREYDYAQYHEEAGENYLIPLEIIFRNEVPIGSSLRRRANPDEYALPFDEWPDESVTLHEPIIEYSTKFEESDRYLSKSEASVIAGESVSIDDLDRLAREVNALITEQAELGDLIHQDGKIECFYFDGTIKVADVVGTLDENRFRLNNRQVSKEVLRQYHKRTQPEWVEAVAAAKAEAQRQDIADWRSLCPVSPASLPEEVVEMGANLYRAAANQYTGQQWFEAPAVSTVLESFPIE